MIDLLDINARVEVSLKNDTSEPKTIFVLRPLTGPERMDVGRFLMETGPDKKLRPSLMITGEYSKALLSRAIVEVKDGKENLSIAEIVDRLEPIDLIELVTKVGEISSLTEKERKN